MECTETKLYGVRWLILALLFLMKVLNNFIGSGSGLINNFYVSYFGVSYAAVDWIVLANFVGSIVTTPIVAVLVFLNLMRFRKLGIVATTLIVVASLCFVVALLNNKFFFLTVASGTIGGIPAAILDTLPGVFASLWFPEYEVGTAVGVVVVGTSVGTILGPVVLTHVVASHFSKNINDTFELNNSVANTSSPNAELTFETRIRLVAINSALLVTSVCVLIVFAIYAKDVPSLPPTVAQALKREERVSEKPKLNCSKVKKDNKTLWCDRTFVVACIVFGIEYHANTFEYTLLGEMLRETNTNMSPERSTAISGYTVTCFSAGACFGCFLSGFIMDRYKRYSIQTIVGSALAFLTSIGFLLGFQAEIYWLVMFSNVLYGISTRLCIVPLYDMITQHTYPIDETFSSAWLTCVQSTFAILLGELSRVMYCFTSSLGVLTFHSGTLFLAFVSTLLVRPKYNRLLANDRTKTEENSVSESAVETTKLR